MKILFLDIDGVMNNLESLRFPRTKVAASRLSFSAAHPSCVAALNRITDSTDARLVISSTWRGIGLQVLREIFKEWGVTGKIIGLTPNLGYVERGKEIASWLRSNPSIKSLVILDDGDDMADLKPHLVQTNYEIGLTDEDGNRAIALLNVVVEAAA